jgi:hypothetical protein
MSLNYSKLYFQFTQNLWVLDSKVMLKLTFNSLCEPAIFVCVKNAPIGLPEVSSVFQNVVFWVLMSCSPAGGYKQVQ